MSVEELLKMIHIDLYYHDENMVQKCRSFEDVILELSEAWDALSEKFKYNLYWAMGIPPYKKNQTYMTPFNPKEILFKKGTETEYLDYEITCRTKGEVTNSYK